MHLRLLKKCDPSREMDIVLNDAVMHREFRTVKNNYEEDEALRDRILCRTNLRPT